MPTEVRMTVRMKRRAFCENMEWNACELLTACLMMARINSQSGMGNKLQNENVRPVANWKINHGVCLWSKRNGGPCPLTVSFSSSGWSRRNVCNWSKEPLWATWSICTHICGDTMAEEEEKCRNFHLMEFHPITRDKNFPSAFYSKTPYHAGCGFWGNAALNVALRSQHSTWFWFFYGEVRGMTQNVIFRSFPIY